MEDRLTSEPTLAVVMPAYNEAASIREILTRVLDLSCVREVVVVDDGSTDATAAIVESFDSPRGLKPAARSTLTGKAPKPTARRRIVF